MYWHTRQRPWALVASFLLVLPAVSGCSGPTSEPEADEPTSVPDAAPAPATEVTNLAALGQQARAAKDEGDWATAGDFYRQAIEIAPGQPVIYERLAEVEMQLGELDDAADQLARLASLGGTTSQIDEPLFAPLLERPGFAEIADQIRRNGAPQQPAEIFVRFDDSRLTPEGIARDAETGDLYTGSFLLHKIVKVGPDGAVSDFSTSADDELGGVLGLWVDAPRRELWAVSGSTSMHEMTHPAELVRYNVETGDLVGRYAAPDTGEVLLVNDVVVTPDGTAWVTESLAGGLYRVPPDGDRLERFVELPGFGFPNGIGASDDGKTIYIGHAEGLTAVDTETGAFEPVVPQGPFTLVSADGLSWVDGSLVLVQNQPALNNRVVVVDLDATGRKAMAMRQLACGLPEGLEPYTSAVGGGFVFVTISPPITPDADLSGAPPPGIVRLPL